MARTFSEMVIPAVEPRLDPGEALRAVAAAALDGEDQRDGIVAMAELLAAAHDGPDR